MGCNRCYIPGWFSLLRATQKKKKPGTCKTVLEKRYRNTEYPPFHIICDGTGGTYRIQQTGLTCRRKQKVICRCFFFALLCNHNDVRAPAQDRDLRTQPSLKQRPLTLRNSLLSHFESCLLDRHTDALQRLPYQSFQNEPFACEESISSSCLSSISCSTRRIESRA